MTLSQHFSLASYLRVAVSLCALAVAGCGGGGGSSTPPVAQAPALLAASNLTGLAGATLVYPGTDGKFDEGQTVQWSPVPTAQGYRLQIGTNGALADVYDSGEILVTQVRVPGLPAGTPLTAELATIYASGEIAVAKFTITASGSDSSFATRLALARGIALDVRNMAGENNVPVDGSILQYVVTSAGNASVTLADCVAYSNAMLLMIAQMNLGVQARPAHTCLVTNLYDCHTLVELYDQTTGRWELIDPTFGLAPHNAADGSNATLDDMRNATRSENWNAITYEYLTPSGDSFASLYYLDYPLLFANTYLSGSDPLTLSEPVDPDTVTKFYQTVGPVVAPGQFGAYALQCPAGAAQATATVDGTSQTFDCDPTLAVTRVFLATTAESQGSAVLLAPIRVHFPPDSF